MLEQFIAELEQAAVEAAYPKDYDPKYSQRRLVRARLVLLDYISDLTTQPCEELHVYD